MLYVFCACLQFGLCMPDASIYCQRRSCKPILSPWSSSCKVPQTRARVRHVEWVISTKKLAPDGFTRNVSCCWAELLVLAEQSENMRQSTWCNCCDGAVLISAQRKALHQDMDTPWTLQLCLPVVLKTKRRQAQPAGCTENQTHWTPLCDLFIDLPCMQPCR